MRNASHFSDSTLDSPTPSARGARPPSFLGLHSDPDKVNSSLEHAVNSLVTKQLESRRHPVKPNREAIVVVCRALGDMALRRAPSACLPDFPQ